MRHGSWNLRSSQREWDDWLGIFVGIAIGLAPWIVEEVTNSHVVANAAVVGVIILILAEADLVNVRRWIDDLLPLVSDRDVLGVEDLATHHLPLDAAPDAYSMFQEKRDGAIKVVFRPG